MWEKWRTYWYRRRLRRAMHAAAQAVADAHAAGFVVMVREDRDRLECAVLDLLRCVRLAGSLNDGRPLTRRARKRVVFYSDQQQDALERSDRAVGAFLDS